MAKVLGIDLGTTNSCMAVIEHDEPVVIPNAEGNRTTPSVVAFRKDGERLVGEVAKRQAVMNPLRTISSVKRKIGSRHRYEIDGREYSPEEISAFILMKMKADAEAYLGDEVKQAVITVPAYFDDSQRTATKNAGEIAGLEVLRIINEPTAASLAYGLERKGEEQILVYDLGGGTFDVSVLEVGDGVFEVKSTSGDTQLGGDDFDALVVEWLVKEFKGETGIDLSGDPAAMQRLRTAAEKAKKELSSQTATEINEPFISGAPEGPVHLVKELTRARFDELTADLVNRTRGPFDAALRDSGIKTSELDEVVLVGGSTRMPSIQELVRRLTGKEPHRGVNPDEVVAVGAAIQAGVLAGEVGNVVLLDVTPLSLGIETMGGVFHKIIERNTTIPVTKTQTYSTAEDSQTAVDIQVYQGERSQARLNKLLGQFRLDGIPPAPRGMPQIEVSFDLDANGILQVTAKDKATSREQKVTIQQSGALSSDEIEQMVRDAERFAAEDKTFRERQDARNELDSMVLSLERMLRESGENVPADDKTAVEAALAKAKTVLEDENATADTFRAARDELQQSSYAMAERMYQAQTPPEGEPAPGGPSAGASDDGGDDIIDVEFADED
ncbi:MAG TPA: molecular chaperone DnaK [Armatimonadetes bacterium]|nr:molecular chaperone DnaK [Armatimonadota bacterium]